MLLVTIAASIAVMPTTLHADTTPNSVQQSEGASETAPRVVLDEKRIETLQLLFEQMASASKDNYESTLHLFETAFPTNPRANPSGVLFPEIASFGNTQYGDLLKKFWKPKEVSGYLEASESFAWLWRKVGEIRAMQTEDRIESNIRQLQAEISKLSTTGWEQVLRREREDRLQRVVAERDAMPQKFAEILAESSKPLAEQFPQTVVSVREKLAILNRRMVEHLAWRDASRKHEAERKILEKIESEQRFANTPLGRTIQKFDAEEVTLGQVFRFSVDKTYVFYCFPLQITNSFILLSDNNRTLNAFGVLDFPDGLLAGISVPLRSPLKVVATFQRFENRILTSGGESRLAIFETEGIGVSEENFHEIWSERQGSEP